MAGSATGRAAILMVKGLLAIGLVLAIASDADGDPTTDNLPHAVLARRVDKADVVVEIDDATGSDDLPRQPWSLRRWRQRWVAARESSWRSIAIPERGP